MNNIEKLLSILIAPAQDIENTLQALKLERFVNTAVGAQLDVIGRIVGQDREGLADADYRRYIRARVATNNSEGRFEDLILIATLVIFDNLATYVVTNEGTATVRLVVDNVVVTDAVAAILFKFAQEAVSAGVRLVLEWYPSAEAGLFQFDAGPGFNQGHLAGGLG